MSYLELANWQALGDHQYRTVRLYESMLWGEDVDIDDFLVVAAPYGGPIALARDPSKVTAFRLAGPGAADQVTIYSAAGSLIGRANTDASRLVGIGWAANETLVVVHENGSVGIFDVRGERSDRSFSVLPSLSDERLVEAAVAGNALAALSRRPDDTYALYLVYDLDKPLVLAAAETGLDEGVRPTCMALIDGAFTAHGRAEVLLGSPDNSLIVVTSEMEAQDAQLDGIIPAVPLMLAVSPKGKYLAVLGEDGSLTVLDTAFERKLVEFETKATSPPSQVVWCGEDSVAVTWADRGLMVVGPFGDFIKMELDEPVVVVQEVDGLRILTNGRHELLQRVPSHLLAVRSIGSTSPGALLLDACAMFLDEDAKCDEAIRSLLREPGALADGVAECIGAALAEFDPANQRALLKAVSYGKSFDPEIDAGPFVGAAKALRSLNALRNFDVGLPLTYDQFEALTPPVVVDRLLSRHAHRLALHLCDYLGLRGEVGRDKVLVHWACAKVRASGGESDEGVRDSIRRKLLGVASVSYADIAATADSAGRRRLATMLLDYEPRVADQVPILLKMREGRLALEKALDSGDTELIFMCLMHLRRAMKIGGSGDSDFRRGSDARSDGGDSDDDGSDDGGSSLGSFDSDGEGRPARRRKGKAGKPPAASASSAAGGPSGDGPFLKVVVGYPLAVSLLSSYASAADPDLLLQLYLASGRYVEAGSVVLRDAYACRDVADRARLLKKAIELFGRGEKALAPPGSAAAAAAAAAGGGPGAGGGGLDSGPGLSGSGGLAPPASSASSQLRLATFGPASLAGDRARSQAAFMRAAAEEQLDLLRAQAELERDKDAPGTFLDQPLCDTLFTLVAAGEAKKVAALVKDFKVPEPQFYYVKIRALASQRDWAALTAFSNERRPPIGFRPFADVCVGEGATLEAKKYAMRLPDYDEKVELLLSLGAFTEAAEIAAKAKDGPRLQLILETAPTAAAKDISEKALVGLGLMEAAPSRNPGAGRADRGGRG